MTLEQFQQFQEYCYIDADGVVRPYDEDEVEDVGEGGGDVGDVGNAVALIG